MCLTCFSLSEIAPIFMLKLVKKYFLKHQEYEHFVSEVHLIGISRRKLILIHFT